MAGYGWVSFTTDYGWADGFVAACHGVIAQVAPRVRVIDVTHQVPPGDIRRGAAVLADTVAHLPAAVHLAVVDPGVGTDRRAVAIGTDRGVLVGPDNGLLRWAAEALGGARTAVELTNPDWRRSPVSWTFHGRDVFAPAAARIAAGEPLAHAGPVVDPGVLVRLPTPVVRAGDGGLEAEVVTVDRFGNLQLAADATALAGVTAPAGAAGVAPAAASGTAPGGSTAGGAGAGAVSRIMVEHGGRTAVAVLGRTFADAPPGGLVVLVDSAGRVAVAVHGGRASDLLGAGPGDLLRLAPAGS